MVTKAVSLLIAIISFNISVSAQNDKNVALTINGKPISKSELQNEFNKSQSVLENGQKQSIDNYLENYIFHALVLDEAHYLRLDTTVAYKRELDSYKLQLTNSFLKDTITENELIADVLKRSEEEIKVNQVFIPFDSVLILPSDTMVAYQKALKARSLAISDGFDKVPVVDKVFSYGVVMDIESETGELGWIKPFIFSYKLEEILYSIKLNEVTMPIRSGKGYHVLQVTDRRPAQGNPVVEQVMFNFAVIPASRQIQDSIYNVAMKTHEEIALKGNFQEICNEFSLAFDRGDEGCLLGEVRMEDKIPASIVKAAFELKQKGEISKPILTDYGYHILRLKYIKPTSSEKVQVASIKSLLTTDKIYPELLARQRKKMLKNYKGKVNVKAYDKVYKLTAKYNPKDEAFEDHVTNKDEVLFSIDNKRSYTVEDFLEYVDATLWLFDQPKDPEPLMQSSFSPMVILTLSSDILDTQFNGFLYTALAKYEKETLGERDAEFARIVAKLSEDLLFTRLMEEEVWVKSRTNIKELNRVFHENKTKYSLKNELFKGKIIFAKNEKIIAEIEVLAKHNIPTSEQLKSKYNSEELFIQIQEGLWDKGDNQYVDSKINNSQKIKSSLRNFPYYAVLGRFITSPEDLSDVRAQVEKDYQDELERNFTKRLKEKYNVTINNAAIKEIK